MSPKFEICEKTDTVHVCMLCYQLYFLCHESAYIKMVTVVMVTGYSRSESVRHVNFRWQRGKKIGQLFSVLSSVRV